VAPGNNIVFQFYPGHHSVTQSSFSDPCHPLSANSIYSGFVDSSDGPAAQDFTVPITSTDPIYIYCGYRSHCQSGMVMAINPPSSGNTLNAYRSAAAGASGSTNPAQVQGGTLGPPPGSVSPDGSCGGYMSYTCSGSQNGIQPCCSASGFW